MGATPDERLSQLSDVLIQSVIKPDTESLRRRQELFSGLPVSALRNENYIIYLVFYNFKERHITPDAEFMSLYLLRNVRLIRESKQYINTAAFAELDEDEAVSYTSAVLKQFNRLLTLEPLAYADFMLALEKYRQEFSAYEIGSAYSQARLILYDGLQVGRRYLQGYEDSAAYVKGRMVEIDGLMNSGRGSGFIDLRSHGLEEDTGVAPERIGGFDLLTKLEAHLGGIFTHTFYSICAPTKGGKSKFTTRMIHNIVVQAGNNVSVWIPEGGYVAWCAQLRAIHFEYLYIRNKPENEKVAPLSQKQILQRNYPSDAIRALEEASKLDLFTNPAYGSINAIDMPLRLESFVEHMGTSVKLNDSKAVLVDYLQLMSSDNRSLNKNQIISYAYQEALKFCNAFGVAFFSPAQFTQEFMKEMATAKGGSHETRVAGGESSEVVRTPDINIALYASVDDLIRHKMVLMSMPSRQCESFPDEEIYTDLRSCVFASVDS